MAIGGSMWRGARDGALQSEARFLQPARLRRDGLSAVRDLRALDVLATHVAGQRLHALSRLRRAAGGAAGADAEAAAAARTAARRSRLVVSLSEPLLRHVRLRAHLRRPLL